MCEATPPRSCVAVIRAYLLRTSVFLLFDDAFLNNRIAGNVRIKGKQKFERRSLDEAHCQHISGMSDFKNYRSMRGSNGGFRAFSFQNLQASPPTPPSSCVTG